MSLPESVGAHPRKPIARLIAASLLCVSSVTSAQGMLEEIVVTAQKRAENLQEVPVSISAITGSELERLRFRDSGEIAAQIPNLQATNTAGDGFPIFSLRGVAMSDFSFNQASPVASYIDEVYKGNPAIQGVQIFDLERIEVLRGPQGTLYGKNSTGGAVNFITRKPGFETAGNLSLGAGNFSLQEVSGAFETALIDEVLALRVAGTWAESDGWFENKQGGMNDANAVDEYGIRASILWQPTERLEVLLRYTTTDQDAQNYAIQPVNITDDGVGAGLYGLYNALGATDKVDYQRVGLDFWEMESDRDINRELSNDALALTLNWEISDHYTLTSITSWDDGEINNPEDSDGSPLLVLQPDYYGEATQYTQDLRISSDLDGSFNFIAGAYYASEEVDNATNIGFWQDLDMNIDGSLDFLDCVDVLGAAFEGSPVTDAGIATEAILNSFGTSLAAFAPASCQFDNEFSQDRTSYAGYFDASYDVDAHWTLRAGLRYTKDETELKGFSARLLGSDGTPLVNTIPGAPDNPLATAADEDFSDDEWTGRLGIDYLSDAGMLLYASYNHGYRSGAYNAQAFLDPSELTRVEPETLDSFEIGMKGEYWDGRLRLNAAAFYYTYEDQQFLNVDAATLAQTLINIDESTIKGMELELVVAPLPNLTVQAGLGVLDSEVDKGVLSGVDLKGNDLVLAPELNFNAAIDWQILDTGLGTLALHADASYVDDHYFEVFNTDRLQQDGYWVSNARLDFYSSSERWQIGAWVKNIADEEYRTSAIDLQASFGYDYTHIGAPRTYGAEIRFNF